MTNDVFESISQGSSRTEDAENCRIQEIANELHRRSCLYEEELRESKNNVRPSEIECRVAEGYAKEKGLWLPIAQVFGLGGNQISRVRSNRYIVRTSDRFTEAQLLSPRQRRFHQQLRCQVFVFVIVIVQPSAVFIRQVSTSGSACVNASRFGYIFALTNNQQVTHDYIVLFST
jgi:hypothetical protein